MTKDTSGPAFPTTQYANGISPSGHEQGMTLRDYFAAQALAGMMASRNPHSPRFHPEDDAAYAYAVAAAMLKKRQA